MFYSERFARRNVIKTVYFSFIYYRIIFTFAKRLFKEVAENFLRDQRSHRQMRNIFNCPEVSDKRFAPHDFLIAVN